MNKSHIKHHGRRHILYLIPVACAFCLLISSFFGCVPAGPARIPTPNPTPSDHCSGRYVYIHNLPTRFNYDILLDCHTLSTWTDMCLYTSNAGLGPRLDNPEGCWFATNQFALEVIFHNRMKNYECLTDDAHVASAVFVPYYAGLDVARYLWPGYNTTVRDSTPLDLVRWLTSKPEWEVMGGKDHFLVAGRITWDFRRQTDEDSDWGNKLFLLPEVQNMTALVIESSPWHNNDVAIPYPTYFHPSSDRQVLTWQEKVSKTERKWLFSFAGAPRQNQTESIRGRIIEQCRMSSRCNMLECDLGVSKCHSPGSVMQMFESSIFCLQPQGDSYTRRSTFDAMVAGCVPVFFHPGSAYVQYKWHLPGNYTRYSVFISEDEVREGSVRIEEVLGRFNEDEVTAMREEVVGMIPRLIYGDPGSKLETSKDAFDVTVEGVIERVREIREGVGPVLEEEKIRKYGPMASREDWDHFFSK